MPKGQLGGHGVGRFPDVLTKLTDEEILAFGYGITSEESCLGTLGLKPYQIEAAKGYKRWRAIPIVTGNLPTPCPPN